MTPDTYRRLFSMRVMKNFGGNKSLAGRKFGCSGTLVALVMLGERAPNKQMLAYTGHKRIKTPDKYIKVKKCR